MQETEQGWPRVLDIYFENNGKVAFSWEEAITLERAGMYYLWFVICDENLSVTVVRGQTTWKNPAGTQPITVATNTSLLYQVLCKLASLRVHI